MAKLSTLGVTAAAAALATATPATEADAATIIQTSGSIQKDSIFTLQQFDSSLGTLESVNIMVSAAGLREEGNPNPTTGGALFTLRGYVSMDPQDSGAPLLPTWENTIDKVHGTLSPYFDLTVGGPNQTTTLTSGLDAFIGASSFNYKLNGGVDVISASAPYGPTLRDSARAIYTVTYNFNEAVAAVPEPSTWAMMITGFGLVGGAMRRRNSKAANDSSPAPAL